MFRTLNYAPIFILRFSASSVLFVTVFFRTGSGNGHLKKGGYKYQEKLKTEMNAQFNVRNTFRRR